MLNLRLTSLALCSLLPISSAKAEAISIVSWNVESGNNNPAIISQEIKDDFHGVDLWGLSEVSRSSRNLYRQSASSGEGFSTRYILGRSGGGDRLMIIYNADRFVELEAYEIDELKFGGGRAPLVAKFKLESSGLVFLFVVNHLHRKSAWKRNEQAKGLVGWASRQTIPVIAVGDYNFDYDVPSGPGNKAFDLFFDNDEFTWVRPDSIVSTQYSDEDQDGVNDHNSVLDFVFTSGDVTGWQLSSEIYVRDEDFPDDALTSDHRPVLARIETRESDSLKTVNSISISGVEYGRTVGRTNIAVAPPESMAEDELRSRELEAIRSNAMLSELVRLRQMIERLIQPQPE